MMPRRRQWTVVLGAVAVAFAVAKSADATDLVSFRAFWAEFRAAALSDDFDRLTEMTALPLVVEDALDTETTVDDPAAVADLLPDLLEQDAGLSAEPESMRAYVRDHAEAVPSDLDPDGQSARVGQFVFEFRDGRWLLTRAYLE